MAFWINIYGCLLYPRHSTLKVNQLKNDSYFFLFIKQLHILSMACAVKATIICDLNSQLVHIYLFQWAKFSLETNFWNKVFILKLLSLFIKLVCNLKSNFDAVKLHIVYNINCMWKIERCTYYIDWLWLVIN